MRRARNLHKVTAQINERSRFARLSKIKESLKQALKSLSTRSSLTIKETFKLMHFVYTTMAN